MDPAAKPARGRKRQPKKGAKAQEEQAGGGEGSSQWEAAGAITPGQEEGEAAEPAAAPKPSLSQRLTQSIKQLSHFGAKPAKEDGEEVEQVNGEAAPAEKEALGLSAPEAEPATPDANGLLPRRLHLSQPWLARPALTKAVPIALALLVLVLAAGKWQRAQRAAIGLQQQLGERVGAAAAAAAQHAQQLRQLAAGQQGLQGRLAALTASVTGLQSALPTEVAAAAGNATASLRAQLQRLEAALGQQAKLIKDLQATPATAPPPLAPSAVAELVAAEVQRALELHYADGTGLPDYALASTGGRVLAHSRLVQAPAAQAGLVGGVTQLFSSTSEVHQEANKFLLAPGNEPGRCLPLAGASGWVDIHLAAPITPTAFSYEHIPPAIAFDIRTAPRTLALYALSGPTATGASNATAAGETTKEKDPATGLQLLGRLEYSVAAGSRVVQTAAVTAPPGGGTVGAVRLVVQANQGHSEYTCLYRIRVHGSHAA